MVSDFNGKPYVFTPNCIRDSASLLGESLRIGVVMNGLKSGLSVIKGK